jgi:hypothetical protein
MFLKRLKFLNKKLSKGKISIIYNYSHWEKKKKKNKF